jgi:hypothetical protein
MRDQSFRAQTLSVVLKLQGTRDRSVPAFYQGLLAWVAILPCLDWHWSQPCHVWDGLLAMPTASKPGERVAVVIVCHSQPPPCMSKGPNLTAIDRNFKILKSNLKHQTGLTRTGQGEDLLLGIGPYPARGCNN